MGKRTIQAGLNASGTRQYRCKAQRADPVWSRTSSGTLLVQLGQVLSATLRRTGTAEPGDGKYIFFA